MGTCPGLRYATANAALGETPVWGRRQQALPHAHPAYMLEFIKTGSMEFGMNGASTSLGPGSYYIMAPGIVHSHAVEAEISTIHVALRPEFVRQVVREVVADPGLPSFPLPARRASPAMEALLRRMVQEARQSSPWRRLLVDTLATELVVQLMRDHGVASLREQPADEADGVSRAIALILAGYDRDLTLEALAAEAGMSRFHFLRVFKRRAGLTPAAYVRQVRLEQAADLLRHSDLPVTEVAVRCGFNGPNRLAEAVRRTFGVAPGELRGEVGRGGRRMGRGVVDEARAATGGSEQERSTDDDTTAGTV